MNSTSAATRATLLLRIHDAKDVAAWDEFTEIYGPVVYRVATRRGLQSADAENLVQSVFLSVVNSLPDWMKRTDRGPFRAWIRTIARNEAIDMLTRVATRPLGYDGADGSRMLAEVSTPGELSKVLELEYQQATFQWAAEQVREVVNEQTWNAFWLTAVEEIPVNEVAARLNIRPANIYLARSRVMTRIKQIVNQQDVENE